MDHAAAAAVLRSAYITRSGDTQAQFGLILLESRAHGSLADRVRARRPANRRCWAMASSARYTTTRSTSSSNHYGCAIPLRSSAEAVSTDPSDSISARDVVDGLALRDAWRANIIPFQALTVPRPTSDELRALGRAPGSLDETLDAMADLLTADSVYQLVRGTTSAAGASLDALASDARPPEGDIATSAARWHIH